MGFRTTYLIVWELWCYFSIHCGTVDCLIVGLFAIRGLGDVSLGKRLTTAAGTLQKARQGTNASHGRVSHVDRAARGNGLLKYLVLAEDTSNPKP